MRLLRASVPALGLLLLSCSSPTTPGTASGATSGERAVVSTQLRVIREEPLAGADIADAIDALFLGSGPYVAPNAQTACPVQRVWTGFPRGTIVRVRVSSVVPPETRAAIRQALSQVRTATRGAVPAVVEETPELDPAPGVGEVTVTSNENPRAVGCRADSGCVNFAFSSRGILQSIRVVEAPTRVAVDYVRDVVARGVLGMCQVNGRRLAAAGGSLMSVELGSVQGLTPVDLEATKAVYGSTLDPGAPRSEFVRAGLVHLNDGT